MAIVEGSLQLGYKDSAWFTANASTVLLAGQIVYLEQTGTYKLGDGTTQLSALSFLGGGGTVDVNTIGAAINGANSATPNDTDLVMSVDTSVAKKNTWTQIKAFLKTYFDTIYTTTSAVASQITTALSGYATQAYVTSQGYITNVVTALGYTPEDAANKTSTVIGNEISTSKYLTVKGVYDWVTGFFVKKGTLTINTIPKATASDTIGDSSITDNGSGFAVTYGGQDIFYGDATEAFIGLSTNEFVDVIAARTEIKHSTEIKLNSPVINTQLTASQIVETDASKNLVSAAKGTAYNKNFGTGTTNVVEIGSTLGNSEVVETNASGKLITASKNTGYNLALGTTAGTVLEGNRITQTITNGVTDKVPSEDAVFDALALKLSSTKERLLFVGGFAAINPADGLTYYSGEVTASVATTTQSSYKFQFNENLTITKAVISVRQVTNPTNESVSFYLRASGTTDQTITTSMDMNSIGASTNKVFVYSGLNLSVTAGTDYENKMLCPTWATNPTNTVVIIKYYGY